jgi:hypothetical protein
MVLLLKEVQQVEFAQSQKITSHTLSVFFRSHDLCRQHAVRRNSTRSNSISSSTGPDLLVTHLTIGFKNGTFAYMFQLLNASSFSMLDIYIHNGLLRHRIELSSTKFEIHTIKPFSYCSVVERHSVLHRHSFC